MSWSPWKDGDPPLGDSLLPPVLMGRVSIMPVFGPVGS